MSGASVFSAGAQSEFSRGDRMPYDAFDKLPKTDLDVPGGVIHVGFAPGDIALPQAKILDWIKMSAKAVSPPSVGHSTQLRHDALADTRL